MKKITYPKLPPKFKTKWLKALRSGEYEQGESDLFNKKTNTYCCLGVACNIAGHQKSLEIYEESYIDKMPARNVPAMLRGLNDDTAPSLLADMNDATGSYGKRRSFKQIANWIERNL